MMPDSSAATADPLCRGVELRVSWFTSRIIRKDTLRTQNSKLETFLHVPCNSISSLDLSASLGGEPERGRRLDCARDPDLVEGRQTDMNHAG